MPVISTRRYSSTTGGSYLSTTGTGTISASAYRSCFRPLRSSPSPTRNNSTDAANTSSYYTHHRSTSSNTLNNTNDSISARLHVGVSSSTRYTRKSIDRDILGKPPPSGGTYGGSSTSSASGTAAATRYSRTNYNDTKSYAPSSSLYRSSSPAFSTRSTSALVRSVATSGVDLYEKYSPAHYIPKCELSRSRSLSESTSQTAAATATATSNAGSHLSSSNSFNTRDRDNNIDGTSPSRTTSASIASKARSSAVRNSGSTASTSGRYWDRDGRSSIASRTLSDSDAYPRSNSVTDGGYSRNGTTQDDGTEGLCGLRNIGNTCFMNSVIQCLSHTSELLKFLRNKTSGTNTASKDQRILHEFCKLIREMWTTTDRSVTPSDLKSAFSSKHRMYSGCGQQDAQEFLRFFLDSLHSALNSGTKGERLEIDDSLSDNKKADLTWEWYAKIENSVVRDLFVGQLKSTLKCTVCGNTSVTFDPFWDLSVPLPSSSRCKLESCLDLFIREEVLDGDEMPTCAKCQKRRKCTKTFTIQRFPKYLVIHLKRFSETRWSKLSNIVEFPTDESELNMGPYASNSSSAVLYSLYGISNHMGSTAGGHYVALCKHPITQRWHEFNDNTVTDANESSLISSSAYILFYERV